MCCLSRHPASSLLSVLAIVGAASSFAIISGAASPSPATSTTLTAAMPFEIDLSHSTMNFRIRHLGVSWFYGRVNMPEGEFLLDANDLSNSHVNISVATKNLDGGNEGRNKFLTGIDFFNVMEFPTAEFKSTSLKPIDKSTWEVTGNFTMHGVTKPITVRLEEYAESPTKKFGFRAGFLCTFTVKRSDYGMSNFMDENMLGDEVQITAAIEGARES